MGKSHKNVAVRTVSVYTLAMSLLTVQTPGAPLIKLDVDDVEVADTPNGQSLTAKKDGKTVGFWHLGSIVGYWFDHDDDSQHH